MALDRRRGPYYNRRMSNANNTTAVTALLIAIDDNL